MQTFLDRVAQVLEVPSVSAEDDFRASPVWGSLAVFSLIIMIEQYYGKTLSATDIAPLKTVADLAHAAGV